MNDDQRIDDGGPAFPRVEHTRLSTDIYKASDSDGGFHEISSEVVGGMSIRDYFACHSPSARILESTLDHLSGAEAVKALAALDYLYADAMIAQRKRGR